MRITTYRKAALADTGNRRAAKQQLIRQTDQDILFYASHQDQEQWIDDLINDWVDELQQDLDRGLLPS